ncbi:hypothetical protein GCM10010307_34720 [Streptomyces vastus]|uniref:Recombinase domain-containing protein n=1 Tax=Streptomyces vastus TaxID=285451 RepID=A0ABN3QWU6_9ACTN
MLPTPAPGPDLRIECESIVAYAQPNPVLPRPTHPMAKTGYGKRAVGDESPHADADFAHLCPRDAEFAIFIDHLDDGHAMGHKVIAAEHPRYGQQASRTSLRSLTEFGHLRWIKEHITVEDNSMRWVTRTYWSRTPRSLEWWAEFTRERHGRDVTQNYQPGLARMEFAAPAPALAPDAAPAPDVEPTSEAEPTPEPSAAYLALAQLRTADPRMALSEAECRALEPRAAEWLSRGATPADMTRALTDGLPPTVTNPGGLARNRLESKMPPQKNSTGETSPGRPLRARVTRVIMACATCDADERTAKIIRGGACPRRRDLGPQRRPQGAWRVVECGHGADGCGGHVVRLRHQPARPHREARRLRGRRHPRLPPHRP